MEPLFLPFFFVAGALIGTFLTTCIERLPFEEEDFFYEEEEEPTEWYYRIPMFSLFLAMPLYTRFKSLIPASRCPACKKRLPWREKIAIVSFIMLGGRCSGCRFKIPPRHLFVEIFTGVFFVIFAMRFGFTIDLLVSILLISLFMVATVVDFRYQIIPDEVNLFGLIAGFILAIGRTLYWTANEFYLLKDQVITKPMIIELLRENILLKDGSLGFATSGFLAGAGSLMLLYYIGTALARTEAMGGGDVKLAGFIGLFLGAKGVLVALFWSTILGAVFGVAILFFGWGIKEGGFTKFAFGPYICAGTLLTLYFTVDGMVDAYMAFNGLILTLVTPQQEMLH